MTDLLAQFNMDMGSLLLMSFCALLVGMSKTGMAGIGLLIVPIMAGIFGGRQSTGILLPMLVIADVFAVLYYHRKAEFKYVWQLLPWTALGIGVAVWVGDSISDQSFSQLISVIVVGSIALMLWQDLSGKKESVPNYWWFAALMGFLGGFTTMIGNAAGAVMTLYFLSMRMPKDNFIGSKAWFFMIINWGKMPLHIWVWETITWSSILLDLLMIPILAFGAFAGFKLVKLFPEKLYRYFVLSATFVSALLIFFR